MPNYVVIVDSLVIDGASLINSKQPGQSRTFDDYANDIILPHIKFLAQSHSMVGVVVDVYHDDNLKGETRRKRFTGSRRKVNCNTKPQKKLYRLIHSQLSSLPKKKMLSATRQ